MANNNRTFLTLFTFFLIVSVILYYIIFIKQFGKYTGAESWVKNAFLIKERITSTIQDNKIIIMAGSNCLFGIDSSLLENITGYKVANLSLHASLDLSFMSKQIEECVKPGDIVVMPLEFGLYGRNKVTDFFINDMIEWGEKAYFNKLNLIERIDFILCTPPERIFRLLFDGKKREEENGVYETYLLNLKSKNIQWSGYSYKSFNSHGDILVEESPTDEMRKRYKNGIDYFYYGKIISNYFFKQYDKISEIVKKNKGELILTWPVTIRNYKFDLSRKESQNILNDIKKQLNERNIKIYFNPALFNLDFNFFFNTIYHTNIIGARIRTENLANCLVGIMNNDSYQEIGYEEAIRIVKEKEKTFLQNHNS